MVRRGLGLEQLRAAGKAAQDEAGREAAQVLGKERVAYNKAGVDLSTGTPLLVSAEEAARAKYAAKLARFPYRSAAYWLTNQAYQQGVSNFFSSIGKGASAYAGGLSIENASK